MSKRNLIFFLSEFEWTPTLKKKFSIQNFEFLFVCQVPLEKLRNFLHSQNKKKLMFFMNEKSFLCNFLIEVGFNVWCVVCIKFQLQSK